MDSFLMFGGEPVPLRELLQRAVWAAGATAVNLSGGLDSSLLLALAESKTAYTIAGWGLEEELARARTMAAHAGARHVIVELDDRTYPDFFADAVRAAGTLLYDGRAVESFLFLRRLRALGVTQVLSGVGADEIFLGDPSPAYDYLHEQWALARTLITQAVPPAITPTPLGILREATLPITTVMARALGVDVGLPYLDPGVVAYAAALTRTDLVRGELGKMPLRELAAGLVPDEIRLSPKSRRYAPPRSGRWQDVYDAWLTPERLARFEVLDPARVTALRTRHEPGAATRVLLMLTSLMILSEET